MADKLKFALAVLLLAAGLAGYYLLSGQATIYRVLCVLAGVAACVAVGWFTEPGRRLAVFGSEAVVEAKKSCLADTQRDHSDHACRFCFCGGDGAGVVVC